MDLKPKDTVPENVKEWFKADIRVAREWRKEAKLDYDFRDGHHWTDDEITSLDAQGRPPIVMNFTGVIVDAVCGQEIGSRRETRYIPREEGDVQGNEVLTSASMWFRDRADADDNDSEAFRDTVTAGMGWTESRLDFDDNPEGDLAVERLDPFEMAWEYSAKKKNLAGANRLWRVRCVPIAEARAMFPDFDDDQLDADWAASGVWDAASADPHTSTPIRDRSKGRTLDGSGELKEVILVHLQWVEREPAWRVVIPAPPEPPQVQLPAGGPSAPQGMALQGQAPMQAPIQELLAPPPKPETKLVSEEEYKTLVAGLAEMGLPPEALSGVKQKRKVRYQAFLGSVVLKAGPTACPDHFSFQCITAKRDQNKGQWFGLVRPMRDPQSWYNKWLSQLLHIMNSNAKGGIMAERGAFEDDLQAEENWAKPDGIVWMKQGALSGANQKWTLKPSAQFPAGHQYLTELAYNAIRNVVGVNLEMLGMREASQAGVLEYQRRQSGMTILQPIFDSLKSYRREQGEIILYYIQEFLSDGRLIRVVGKQDEKYLPLMRQAALEYDIIVDDMPTSPNQKEMTWQIVTQMLPYVKDMLTPEVMLRLLKSSPIPSAVLSDIEEMQKKQSESPSAQMQQRMMQLEAAHSEILVRLDQAKIGKTEAETAKIASEIGQQPGGDNGQGRAMIDMQKMQTDAQLKGAKIQADAAAARDKTQATIALGREEIGARVQTEREKIAADRANNQEWMATESADKRAGMIADAMTTVEVADRKPRPTPKPAART